MNEQTPPMATPRVAAGALIRDAAGRILLVKPTYKEGWDIPGGYVEPSESPAAACKREMAEEIGLDRDPGRLLLVDWAPAPGEGDKLLFIFEGGILRDADQALPDLNEISEARFFLVSDLDNRMPRRLARRLTTAAEEKQDRYAEHGKLRVESEL